MNGGAGQKGRIDAAVLRERMEADNAWFAERHAELTGMASAAQMYVAIADAMRGK